MGPMTLKFKLGRDFCTMHLPTKFHRPMFSHLELTSIMLTNKRTNTYTKNDHFLVKNIHLNLLCMPVENKWKTLSLLLLIVFTFCGNNVVRM